MNQENQGVGAYLKRQRQLRGVTLEEIAKATNISRHCLELIERDRIESIPGQVFAKGFIRSYAEKIGLHSDEVLLQFDDQLKDLSKGDPFIGNRVAQQQEKKPQISSWAYLTLAIVLAVVLFFLLK